MKFGFVAKHRGAWPVNLMCEALGVSRGGFYAWLARPRSLRNLSDEVLGAQVHQSFVRSDRTYGARRVWHDVLEQGQTCGLHRIERLMREQALRARPRRRGLPKDRGARSAVADNVLDSQFRADGPNQKWVADFTYIWTAEGWLYVAAVLDLYSRRIVGWSMQESMTSQLVVDALMMAVWRRGKPVALLHHSDQGSQYTSEHFQKLLDEQGITCSMSRAGEVWDSSAMESFFSSLKAERTARKVYAHEGRPVQMCSTTSSASTTRRAGIRRSAISVPYSSSKLKKLRSVSTEPAAAHRPRRPSWNSSSGCAKPTRTPVRARS